MSAQADAPNLDAMLEDVHDERTFIAFVEALANDFALEQQLEAENPSGKYGSGQLGWENGTVDAVLGAAAAWGHIKMLTGHPPPEANPWQRCAHIIYAGKFYE
ncbi:hypothetical protein JQK15_21380 [Sphingobium sp. BHU LFT2]|uniref:DUF7660 family protein n=1 Tax=Sphingobium sp. BHU LFT2 TaxID=2807634 RepID=UPI001BE55CD2|nr:hypothetical protein [Sphingobium sp. BHU LFT2]MBT2246063.1 hypothetical protein [Sphingobium sp. BHU LFT2]